MVEDAVGESELQFYYLSRVLVANVHLRFYFLDRNFIP